MKKLKLLCISFFLGIGLVGCNDVTELSDEENRLIAEYAADLLLKYDLSFGDRIKDGEYKLKKQEEKYGDITTEQITSEEVTTEELTEEASTQANHDLNSSEDVGTLDNSNVGSETDIAKIIGISNASITYKSSSFEKQYTSSVTNGENALLEAQEGSELYVVRFQVKNTGSQRLDLSLINEAVDYKLLCNNNKAAKPMLTIMMEDLVTLETSLDSGQEQEAVLVFQVAESLKETVNGASLYIDYNGTTNVIPMKTN